MKWFRLYSEFFTDPKLKTFTKAQRHDVLALMSLASESKQRGVILVDDEDLAATLELSEEEFAALTAKMEKKGITERCENGRVCFIHFLDRQYDNPSDRPEKVAERKAKHDERKRNDKVTTPERQSNDTYSDSESETESEAEDTKKAPPSEGAAPVVKKSRNPFVKPTEAECLEYFTLKSNPQFSEKFWNYWESVGWKRSGKPMVDWQAAARQWIAEENDRGGRSARASPPRNGRDPTTTLEDIAAGIMARHGGQPF